MDDTVSVIRIAEGESGKIVGRLTEKNLEAIAAIYALPEPVRKRKYGTDDAVIGLLAGRLGCSPAFIRRARRDKRVRARVWEGLVEALDFLFPTILYHQVELALPPNRDTKAARFVGEILGRIKQNVAAAPDVKVNIQTNVAVTSGTAKDGGIAEDSGNFEWLRELHASGDLARLLAAHPVGKTPVEQANGRDPEPAPGQP